MGDPAPGKAEVNMGGWIVRDHFPEGVAPVSKILFDGAGIGTGIGFAASLFTTGIDMSSAIISGEDIILSATGIIKAATSITLNATSVVLDGTISVAAGHTLALPSGTTVNEFSIDGTLAGNSDDAVPTEKAVKTYVDTQILTKDTFLELNDTPSGYTTNGAIYVADNSNTQVDESTVILTEGTNTFAITKGTASLDIAADAVLDLDANLTVSNVVTLAATNAGVIDFGAASKTLTISETCTIDQDLQVSASPTFAGLYIRDASQSIASASDDLMTFTSPTLTIAGATKINLDGPVDLTGKLTLDAQGGTASVSGLLFGIGTTGDPATTDAANANFVELRCETTATSGDDRLMYMRYYMNGINTTGGECLKAGTVLEKKIGTARGGQASIEVSNLGYVSGFACGWDALLEVKDEVLPAGGTYCAGQSQIYITGSTSDISPVALHGIHRFSVIGGDATAEGKVLNAFNFDVANCVGNGLMIEEGANLGTIVQSIRVTVNGTPRYLLLYDAPA